MLILFLLLSPFGPFSVPQLLSWQVKVMGRDEAEGELHLSKLSYGLELVIILSWISCGWEIETKRTFQPCLDWWKLVFLSNPCPQEVFLDKMVTQHVTDLCLPLSFRQRMQRAGTCQAMWDFTHSCTSAVGAAAAENAGNWELCASKYCSLPYRPEWNVELESGVWDD